MNRGFLDYLHTFLMQSHNPLIAQVGMESGVTFEEPLLCAEEMFPRMRDLIISAQNEVLITVYKIDANSDGEQDLIDALNLLSSRAEADGKVICVRILVDRKVGLANLFLPTALYSFSRLRDFSAAGLDFEYAEHEHSLFDSYHAKQIIIDGKSAMLLSGDMTRRNNYRSGGAHWTEMATVLHGEALVTTNIRRDFVNAWNSPHSQPLRHKVKRTLFNNLSVFPESVENTQRVLYIAKREDNGISTRRHRSPFTTSVIEAIGWAQSSVYIVTPNLNDRGVLDALVTAVLRGITIHIVMGRFFNAQREQRFLMGGTNESSVAYLFDQVHRRHGNRGHINIHWAAKDGEILPEDSVYSMHARCICIDDELILLGSSVLDLQSTYNSREADICVQSRALAKRYQEKIISSIMVSSVPFDGNPDLEDHEINPNLRLSMFEGVGRNSISKVMGNDCNGIDEEYFLEMKEI